jgi:uncharacterized protein
VKLDTLRRRYATVTSPAPAPLPASRVLLPVEDTLDGAISPIGEGHSFIREMRFPAGDTHGGQRFTELASLSGRTLSPVTRDPELACADLTRAVFLDTETTGLGMGVGTYVFLVGAGFFDGQSFVVRQFFLGGPGEEPEFLHHLGEFLRLHPCVVTFNGKAFDLPLLESRYARHRRPLPVIDPPHLDLLHPARRLWKRRLPSCALTSLERAILEVVRTEDDVPGWLIPSLYFSYLRQGEGGDVRRVFYHNLHDILSLASLTVRVQRTIEDPIAARVIHGEDYLSLGRIFDGAGEGERALEYYEVALHTGLPAEARIEALLRLGAGHKRSHAWERAIQSWDQVVDLGGPAALCALTELAKYHEHVARDYLQALETVQQALNLAELTGGERESITELEHRRGRLITRVYRQRERAERAVR